MTLDRLTSTTQRLAILNAVVFATKPLSANALAQQLTVSKGLVSRYLDWLVHEGLGRKVHGKFLVAAAAPLVKGLKILLTIGRLKTGIFKFNWGQPPIACTAISPAAVFRTSPLPQANVRICLPPPSDSLP